MNGSATAGDEGYGSLDESALLERLRAGDDALFRQVVLVLTPVLLRLARGYTTTAASAQDAVQDTWLVVLDKLDSFEGRSTLQTWVCGILVNKARRSGVKESRTLPFSTAWRDDRSPAVDPSRFHNRGGSGTPGTWTTPPVTWDQVPEERLAARELQQVIHAAIASLPIRQREVVTARDVVGMDAPEAAQVLGLTDGNQRVLLHRARSKVRAAVEQYASSVIEPSDGSASRASRPTEDRNRS